VLNLTPRNEYETNIVGYYLPINKRPMKIEVMKKQESKTRVKLCEDTRNFLQTDEVVAHYEENIESDCDELHIRAVGLDDRGGTSIKSKYVLLPFDIPSGQYHFDRQEGDYLVFVKI
jgi:hypothetical protein